MKVKWSNTAVVGSGMMLGPVVGVVVAARFPVDDELVKCNSRIFSNTQDLSISSVKD